jgi:hypothetical protein
MNDSLSIQSQSVDTDLKAVLDVRNFMAQVVPWPQNGEGASILVVWGGPEHDLAAKTLDRFFAHVNYGGYQDSPIYFCTSLQRDVTVLDVNKEEAHQRSQAQAAALKAIWLNLNGYASPEEAFDALEWFIDKYKLPSPNAFVTSGNELHVYWIAAERMTVEEWQPYASGLKALAMKSGLNGDLDLTTDCACIMRMPGALNYEIDFLQPARLRGLSEEVTDFRKELAFLHEASLVDPAARAFVAGGAAPNGSGQSADAHPLTIARGYLARGWNPIPVSRQTKKPIRKGWQRCRLDSTTVAAAFNRADMNVGVQSGPYSNGLTDVDLDCGEAVKIGPMLLPESNNVFGRASKRRSHWLYSTTLANKIAKACLQFRDVTNGDATEGAMLLWRGDRVEPGRRVSHHRRRYTAAAGAPACRRGLAGAALAGRRLARAP